LKETTTKGLYRIIVYNALDEEKGTQYNIGATSSFEDLIKAKFKEIYRKQNNINE